MILDSLLNLIKTKQTSAETPIPEGFCPNCWGRTEYGGAFFEAVKNHGVDINSKNPKVGWVKEYADKYLSDIQLKPHEDGVVCSKCKISYKAS